ncbi:VOC family protein [Parafrankia sp. EUN1f]|uniref:VOC family protein n=1 Tax=Parafrankia sp. EUN1f TaxID=102897 RepID=UPI0001C46868|nr:VOC family protein [Parafrankia sp. EUN1f]EFC80741.1 Glyoxalase/bleomycin resistance protein/dioxygenase [Parafrankia sp. EUN1f]
MFGPVTTVMTFADDPEKSARWWANQLDADVHLDIDGESVYAWLTVAGVEIGFHQADDDRNPRGGSPVVYWAVTDLDATRRRLLTAGCVHHRGPLNVSEGRRICQIIDPFGTIIGFEGP